MRLMRIRMMNGEELMIDDDYPMEGGSAKRVNGTQLMRRRLYA